MSSILDRGSLLFSSVAVSRVFRADAIDRYARGGSVLVQLLYATPRPGGVLRSRRPAAEHATGWFRRRFRDRFPARLFAAVDLDRNGVDRREFPGRRGWPPPPGSAVADSNGAHARIFPLPHVFRRADRVRDGEPDRGRGGGAVVATAIGRRVRLGTATLCA